MIGKDIYSKLIMLRTASNVTVPKIAKHIENPDSIDWSKVYSWANKVPIDTKTKEFQYKFANDLLSHSKCYIPIFRQCDPCVEPHCQNTPYSITAFSSKQNFQLQYISCSKSYSHESFFFGFL